MKARNIIAIIILLLGIGIVSVSSLYVPCATLTSPNINSIGVLIGVIAIMLAFWIAKPEKK
jgi:hypothetical protein